MRRFWIISAIVAASAAVLLFLAWWASQVVPEFYATALTEESSERRRASDRMLQKVTVLASDLRKPGSWEGLFTEQEINGWLAVDLKENHGNSLPPRIREPRLIVDPGGVRIACRAQRGRIETVLSVTLDVYLAEPGVLGIRVRGVRAGVLPLPLSSVVDQIRDIGSRQGFSVRWQQTEGDPVALIRIRPVIEGDRSVVIETIELAEGEIYVSGTTEELNGSAR